MAEMNSKEAAAYLDPMNAPEPSAETGLNTHFGSTFAPSGIAGSAHARKTSNPFTDRRATPPPAARPGSRGSPRHADHRAEAFGNGGSPKVGGHHRRTSSLKERFPGDESHNPLDIIRRDSKKAARSPHLSKRHLPGADTVDKLDPAVGGRAYHHEGPYDAALLARNTSFDKSPVAALQTSNAEAIKATPIENVKNAVERHMPLDGVAVVPPGEKDRFGRTYNYEEGTDLMHETFNGEPGYKRYADKDYDPEDLKGESEPAFSLDRALRTHKIDDDGIEMKDHQKLNRDYHRAERDGTLDTRDPMEIAGGQDRYVDLEQKNDKDYSGGSSALKHAAEGLKKRLGGLRKKD